MYLCVKTKVAEVRIGMSTRRDISMMLDVVIDTEHEHSVLSYSATRIVQKR